MNSNEIINSTDVVEEAAIVDNVVEDKKVEEKDEQKQTNLMIQSMIGDYLKKLNLPTLPEILKKVNENYEPGVLTEMHVKLLQCMVKDFYTATGESIEILAKQQGIVLKEGELSKIEKDCVDNLLEDYCKSVKAQLEVANGEN